MATITMPCPPCCGGGVPSCCDPENTDCDGTHWPGPGYTIWAALATFGHLSSPYPSFFPSTFKNFEMSQAGSTLFWTGTLTWCGHTYQVSLKCTNEDPATGGGFYAWYCRVRIDGATNDDWYYASAITAGTPSDHCPAPGSLSFYIPRAPNPPGFYPSDTFDGSVGINADHVEVIVPRDEPNGGTGEAPVGNYCCPWLIRYIPDTVYLTFSDGTHGFECLNGVVVPLTLDCVPGPLNNSPTWKFSGGLIPGIPDLIQVPLCGSPCDEPDEGEEPCEEGVEPCGCCYFRVSMYGGSFFNELMTSDQFCPDNIVAEEPPFGYAGYSVAFAIGRYVPDDVLQPFHISGITPAVPQRVLILSAWTPALLMQGSIALNHFNDFDVPSLLCPPLGHGVDNLATVTVTITS